MRDEEWYSIGELARRTGLPVRTIRFWSDQGLVPPSGRSPSGYRRYDLTAIARLDLVRTLRELGFDLATVRRALDRPASVPELAAWHADALDVQIRTLHLRRAVLRAVARRGSGPEETTLMHRLATLSDAERRRLIHDFVDTTWGDLDANPEFVAMMRAATPDLPDDPTPEQVEAWIALAELVQDPEFRAAARRLAEHQAADRAAGDRTGLHHDLTEQVRERVTAARAAGTDPASAPAAAVVTELVDAYARTFGRTDDAGYRAELLDRLVAANEPRAERYVQLLATINGWPVPPSLGPVFAWFIAALRAHPVP
ncbi:MerR family transcriptional regulator [Micromonospora yasonensis]|uniref:MerR family transcriptional regulator n=1 Tax=Micromonospora yasonensis TaxID=1128667 RepID=UPI0022317644|nr:MerR family transcriptional regulator [Micromonospora yasonensis]MCW3842810.1 MerR family transcriptional regulator [Micromonospora yasonensis]